MEAEREISNVLRLFNLINRKLDTLESKFHKYESRLAKLEASWGCSSHREASSTEGKSVYDELAERISGIVGLKEAATSRHRVTRITWQVLFVVGIAATVVILYQTNEEFLAEPTATRMKLISHPTYKFPPLLLCPEAEWYDLENADHRRNHSRDGLLFGLSYLKDMHPLVAENYTEAKREFLSFYESRNFSTLVDFFKSVAPDLEHSPSIGDNRSAGTSPGGSYYTCRGCDNRSPAAKAILDGGVCYRFSLTPVERGLGVYSSTRMVKIFFDLSSENRSAPISDHEWNLYFNPIDDFFVSAFPKITVHSFYHNTIMFSEHKFVTLPSTTSPCYSDQHDDDETDDYSFVACMTACHNQLYREKLGCGFLGLSDWRLPPSNHCNTLNGVQLGARTLDQYYASIDNSEIDWQAARKCVVECPQNCTRTMYETSLQLQRRYTESERADVVSGGRTLFKVTVKHEAVYQGGVIELSEVDTYTFIQLINNIGGSLGLFVGATLMTFLQAALFVVDLVAGHVRRRISSRVKGNREGAGM